MPQVAAAAYISLLLGLLSLPASADSRFPCPQYGLGPYPYYSAFPWSVALSDLDCDGHPDMAVANSGNDSVSILLNLGDGTFASQLTYDVGLSPFSVATADLDGDGDSDLAVVNGGGGGSVSILLNNGNGTFAEHVTYDVASYSGSTTYSVAIQDLDGDGDPDLAVANHHSVGTVSILINYGDGTFAAEVEYGLSGYGDYARFVTIADFDGDGDGDLAVATGASPSSCVSILLNNGDGTFASCVQYIVGDIPTSVVAGDFDDDGDSDLAVANWYSDNISVLLNNGNGTFAGHVTYATGVMPFSVAIEDMDIDGDADLVVANREDDSVSVLRNQGDGTFSDQQTHLTGTDPYSVAIADLDSDGYPDVVTADYRGHSVSVLRNLGDANLRSYSTNGLGIIGLSVAIGDLDGDGDQDLVYTSLHSLSAVSIALNLGGGSFAAGATCTVGTQPDGMVIADLDGNGSRDLAVANAWDGTISVLLCNGTGTYANQVVYPAGPGLYSPYLVAGDLDGDGDVDLAVPTYSNDVHLASVSILLNNGDGIFANYVTYGVDYGPGEIVIADFDGDGDDDLAVAHDHSSLPHTSVISVLLNQGNGTFQNHVPYTVGRAFGGLVVGDLDGDGDFDLLSATSDPYSTQPYSMAILWNNGSGVFSESTTYYLPFPVGLPEVGDFDGDGDTDFVVLQSVGSGGLFLFMNQGAKVFDIEGRFGTGCTPGRIAIGDLDQDGDADLVLGNGSILWNGPSLTVSLYPDAYSVSATTGGSVNFYLNAGIEKAKRNYILLGGVTGTEPGFLLPGGNTTMPLNWDVFTDIVIEYVLLGSPVFTNFLGTLNENGQSTAQLNIPPIPGYGGILYLAYCLGWPWEFASNPVEIEIVE